MVGLTLNDDRDGVNPMHADLGHFVCVDGFGPVSAEERAAGLPGHGEAHRVPWEQVAFDKTNGTTTVSFTAALPIVQEIFRRTIRDYERLPEHHEAMVYWPMIIIMGRRLARRGGDLKTSRPMTQRTSSTEKLLK